jgi:hypothetical protein
MLFTWNRINPEIVELKTFDTKVRYFMAVKFINPISLCINLMTAAKKAAGSSKKQ